MAYSISVYLEADDKFFSSPPEDVSSLVFDEWEAECLRRTLYEKPLGADKTLYHYWSRMAKELGLPLVTALYDEGLKVKGNGLSQLEEELNVLERHWASLDLSREASIRESTIWPDGAKIEREISFRTHLKERADYMREAIHLARKSGGMVVIS